MNLNAESRIAVARRRGRGRRRMRWGSFHHSAAGEASRGAGRGPGPLLTLPPGGAGFPGRRTAEQKAGGWRAAGAQSTGLLSFSPRGPQ